jgi:hypothetical protein
MTRAALLKDLPTLRHVDQLVTRDQSTNDIVKEVLRAHKVFASDYDKIAERFNVGDPIEISEALYDFLKSHITYEVESVDLQTSRSPGKILYLGHGDCKHYAGFAAGVLDALKRRGEKINWSYRFATYNGSGKEPRHVFVVVRYAGREYWLDPVLSSFNDRSLTPSYYFDKKTDMLKRLSGFDHTTLARRAVTQKSGCTIGLFDPLNPTGTTTTSGGSLPKTGDPKIDAVVTSVNSAIDSLPDGGLKDWLKGFFSDPVGSLKTLIFGRTYTSGDYRLGETYLRNILGDATIQRRGQVPDGAVPQAWEFFTVALGVRILSYDHLEALSRGAQAYFDWMNPQGLANDISTAQAERAHLILKGYGFPENQSDGRRNSVWPLSGFTSKPYILPLPSPLLGAKFTGVNPVDGLTYNNGYPVADPFGTGDGSPIQSGLGGNAMQLLLLGGLAVGALYYFNKKKKSPY